MLLDPSKLGTESRTIESRTTESSDRHLYWVFKSKRRYAIPNA